jgi:hypothetical protein
VILFPFLVQNPSSTCYTGSMEVKPGDLVRHKINRDWLGVVMGPVVDPLSRRKFTKYTAYQLNCYRVLPLGSEPTHFARLHVSYMEVI